MDIGTVLLGSERTQFLFQYLKGSCEQKGLKSINSAQTILITHNIERRRPLNSQQGREVSAHAGHIHSVCSFPRLLAKPELGIAFKPNSLCLG